jgi:hypothetical protein
MPISENSTYVARFNMVFLPNERAMLQALAEDAGMKESALIRLWVSEKYAARFGKKRPGEPVPKYNSLQAREGKPKRAKK